MEFELHSIKYASLGLCTLSQIPTLNGESLSVSSAIQFVLPFWLQAERDVRHNVSLANRTRDLRSHFLVVFLKKITKKEGEAGGAVTLCFRLMVAATTVAFLRGPEKFRLQKFSLEEAWLIPNKREVKQKQKAKQRSVSPLFSKDP